MKTVLCVLLVVAVLIHLCGCGLKPASELAEPAEEPPIEAPETPQEPQEPPEPAAPVVQEPVPTEPAYEITMTLDAGTGWDDPHLEEQVRLSFTNTSEDVWEQICLRDYAASNLQEASSYTEESKYVPEGIQTVRDGNGETLTFQAKEDLSVVYVDLAAPLAPGERTTLLIDYATAIPCGGTRLCWFPTGEGQDSELRVVCLSQAYPVLAQYLEDGWNEAPYFTDGECFFSPCGSYQVTLNLPGSYAVVSTGEEETEESGVWRLSAENVRDFAIIACNAFKVETAQVGDITINSWYYDGRELDRQQGTVSLQAAVDAVTAFTEAWGSYPYAELDVVQAAYNQGGMEYPGMVRISDMLAYDLEEDEEKLRLDVAHEVAHQWFYAVVGNDQYREAWLDESFAVYGELVYLEALGATESELAGRVAEKEGELMEQYINLSYGDYETYASYVQAMYKTGCVFLWELREAMGKENFDALLRSWYEDHPFAEVTTAEFRAAVEAASGGDAAVAALLDQYLKADS